MVILLILTFAVVVGTITYGVVQKGKNEVVCKQKIKKALITNLAVFVPVMTVAIIMNIPTIAHAAEGGVTSAAGLGYLSAALATGIGTIGAGYAVGAVGSAALGAISEDPKILGKTLIYVGLGEGIAIYGLIVSIMILSKL